MRNDHTFRSRKKERKQRKHDFKEPKANSFLIVTEGERTEPLYFEGITRLIREGIGGTVNVVTVPHIEIYGEGRGTGKLIEKTNEIVSRAKIIYQNIWVVFDKDEFADFDVAIALAEKRGYRVAWSNQSFEFWLCLHFVYGDSALHRSVWNGKLDKHFRDYQLEGGCYQKNYENIYALLNTHGSVEGAIKRAKRLMATYPPTTPPSSCDPGTTVHQLVEKLLTYLK